MCVLSASQTESLATSVPRGWDQVSFLCSGSTLAQAPGTLGLFLNLVLVCFPPEPGCEECLRQGCRGSNTKTEHVEPGRGPIYF